MLDQVFSVSDAVSLINQTLEYAYPTITVEGEVANYKVSGGKWVFFDLKDEEMSLRCFSAVWTLSTPLEDGMKIQVLARPRLSKYGFSLNIDKAIPVGEGSIKKAFELLRAKLAKEGLFDESRKQALPNLPETIGVISSVDAAGYKDFIKIIGERFSGVNIIAKNVAVQGIDAPNQIIQALRYFNQNNPPEVIAILRGGGSRDDLVAFDDEALVREIAASKVPVIVGVGHEIDTTLADLAADFRASTPSNAAEILLPDKREIISWLDSQLDNTLLKFKKSLDDSIAEVDRNITNMEQVLRQVIQDFELRFNNLNATLSQLDPKRALRRGYAILRVADGQILKTVPELGSEIQIENQACKFWAKVNKIEKNKK